MPEGTHPLSLFTENVYHGSCDKQDCRWCNPSPPYRPDLEPIGHAEESQRGWKSLSFVDVDGQSWPLEFAARMLDIPLKDLRDLVRITRLEPAGVIRMAGFRRQGRQPRAYSAEKLIDITETIRALSDRLAAST